MSSDTASSVDEQQAQLVTAATSTDNRGRHRILAELNRLEQELKFLQEELGELEKTENVSTICSELLPYIEGRSDPLLPVTSELTKLQLLNTVIGGKSTLLPLAARDTKEKCPTCYGFIVNSPPASLKLITRCAP